jgi:hypothetical protein
VGGVNLPWGAHWSDLIPSVFSAVVLKDGPEALLAIPPSHHIYGTLQDSLAAAMVVVVAVGVVG